MEHYEIRVLSGVTVATPKRKKPTDKAITPAEKAEKKKKSPKKGVNNEEGD